MTRTRPVRSLDRDRAFFHLRQLAKILLNYRGSRRLVIRQELFDLIGLVAPAVATNIGGIWYLVSTEDAGLGRIVFGQGSYEQNVMAYALELAGKLSGRSPLLRGRTFIDIGANIGTSTVPALVRFEAADGIAFEPGRINYNLLRCNLISNEIDERVQAIPVALSDRSGVGTLEQAKGGGDHRIRMVTNLPDGLHHESTRVTTDVQLSRFDDMVVALPIDLGRVGLVWMDTQGHEGHILAGAHALLDTDIPVVLEYWPYGLRRAGGLTLLHELIATYYRRVIDVRASMASSNVVDLPASQVASLEDRYGGETYTDLLLLSRDVMCCENTSAIHDRAEKYPR